MQKLIIVACTYLDIVYPRTKLCIFLLLPKLKRKKAFKKQYNGTKASRWVPRLRYRTGRAVIASVHAGYHIKVRCATVANIVEQFHRQAGTLLEQYNCLPWFVLAGLHLPHTAVVFDIYDGTYQKAHFFREMFKVYVSYIKNDNSLLTYDQFAQKMEKDSSKIKPFIQFLVNVKEDKNNCNRNVLASFHLFLMLFLNKYGLDYHETKREVFNEYARKYNIVIKKGLKNFFERNRISKEVTWIIEELNL